MRKSIYYSVDIEERRLLAAVCCLTWHPKPVEVICIVGVMNEDEPAEYCWNCGSMFHQERGCEDPISESLVVRVVFGGETGFPFLFSLMGTWWRWDSKFLSSVCMNLSLEDGGLKIQSLHRLDLFRKAATDMAVITFFGLPWIVFHADIFLLIYAAVMMLVGVQWIREHFLIQSRAEELANRWEYRRWSEADVHLEHMGLV